MPWSWWHSVDGRAGLVGASGDDAAPTPSEHDLWDVSYLSTQFAFVWKRVLSFRVRYGRNEGGTLARAGPLVGEVVLDNSDGVLDISQFPPRKEVSLDMRLKSGQTRPGPVNGTTGDALYIFGIGRIKDARVTHDYNSGLETITVHLTGLLEVLASADAELGFFTSEAVRTSDVIQAVLRQFQIANRNAFGIGTISSYIDWGQVKVHPAHYQDVIGSHGLTRALPIMRAMELAEGGFLHEGKGDDLVFEQRFHREIDFSEQNDNDVPVIGRRTVGDDVRAEGVSSPNIGWSNLYTTVRIGMSQAVVLDEAVVYTHPIQAGKRPSFSEPFEFVVDLSRTDERNLQNNYVRSVVEWGRVDYALSAGAGTITAADPRDGASRFRRRIIITPTGNVPLQIERLRIYGKGVAARGFAVIDSEADAVRQQYGRRVLELPATFVGDGYNHGNAFQEGKEYAEYLLERYSLPLAAGWVELDPWQNANSRAMFQTLKISDPVVIDGGVVKGGWDTAYYSVEGQEVTYEAQTDYWRWRIFLSKRGRQRTLRERHTTAQGYPWTPTNSNYADAPGFTSWTVAAGKTIVVAIQVSCQGGGTATEAMRVIKREGRKPTTVKTWDAEDMETIDHRPVWLTALLRITQATSFQIQAARATGCTPTLHKIKIIEMNPS